VTILDVGQGDAILVESPSGARVLIDGGPSGHLLARALAEELPASARRIDLVVLTHGQDDHVTGLVSVLGHYDVGAVLTGTLPGTSGTFDAWTEEVESSGVRQVVARAGQWFDLGDGVRAEVIGPPTEPIDGGDALNENSVVIRLIHGNLSFLLTGDLGARGESALLAGGTQLRSTVLKVGHHGSDGSTTPAFIAAVDPRVAVISVGSENPYGHPSPTTRLRLAGVPLMRTDQNGTIRIHSDGRRLEVDYDKGTPRGLKAGSAALENR
jgi:competence protein ComEC